MGIKIGKPSKTLGESFARSLNSYTSHLTEEYSRGRRQDPYSYRFWGHWRYDRIILGKPVRFMVIMSHRMGVCEFMYDPT